MGKVKLLTSFIFGAIFFAACGSAEIKFPYEFFHISPTGVWEFPNGKLVGQGVRYSLHDCAPVKDESGKMVQRCVVVFYSELEKLISDYKQTKQALIDCQRGR